MEITTTAYPKTADGAKLDPRTFTYDVNFGENLAEAIELHGEDVVFNIFKAQAVVKFQGFVRDKLSAVDKDSNQIINSDEDIESAVANWALPSGVRQKMSKLDKARKILVDLGYDEDTIADLLANKVSQ